MQGTGSQKETLRWEEQQQCIVLINSSVCSAFDWSCKSLTVGTDICVTPDPFRLACSILGMPVSLPELWLTLKEAILDICLTLSILCIFHMIRNRQWERTFGYYSTILSIFQWSICTVGQFASSFAQEQIFRPRIHTVSTEPTERTNLTCMPHCQCELTEHLTVLIMLHRAWSFLQLKMAAVSRFTSTSLCFTCNQVI